MSGKFELTCSQLSSVKILTHTHSKLDTMLRIQPARRSIRALKRCQQYSLSQYPHFSSSTRAAAISPHRNPGQILPSKQQKEIVRRGQSTAAQIAPCVPLRHKKTSLRDWLTLVPVKRDLFRARPSIKTQEGIPYTLYKMANCQRWTSRESTLRIP